MTVAGTAFQSLGQFNTTTGRLRVVLTDDANAFVIADAVLVDLV
jgi:hypothetical protein